MHSTSDNAILCAKKRIAREQIAYFLGNTRTKQSIAFLNTQLVLEKDIWVRRAICFGLAFSADKEYSNKYVDTLRQERKNGLCTSESDVNIGFQLSFFGDQPFNVFAPDVDQNLSHCENTIVKCLYLFQTEADRYGWKLNLYTLIDIYHNRAVSHNNFSSTLRKHLSLFNELIKKIENDPECAYWPEILEAKIIAEEVARNS
ncbi:MAG: hypothetical protein LBC70_08190 [Chitinispirillales bacterium]|nr:hypothetical protein [Chitinispirillales bacterium]